MTSVHKKILIIGGTVLLICVIFIGVLTYVFRVDTPLISYARRILHLPAIVVNTTSISMQEIEENTASIKKFYENQDFSSYGIRIDFTTEDGQKRLKIQQKRMLNKLIEDIAIEEMAKKWNITISDEAVKTAMDRPMNEVGTRDSVTENLENLYGWTLDDFGQKVVYGQLLREKVTAKFEQENVATPEMHEKIAQAKKELDDGRSFVDTAMKYSDGSTASEGGVMGWFASNELQDEIGKKIFAMEKGAYTDVIETQLGLHIVRVNDISEKDNVKLVHVSQIVIKKQNFAQYLEEWIKKMNVKIFLPQYAWDAQTGLLTFDDEELQMFEEKMRTEALEMQKKVNQEKK